MFGNVDPNKEGNLFCTNNSFCTNLNTEKVFLKCSSIITISRKIAPINTAYRQKVYKT